VLGRCAAVANVPRVGILSDESPQVGAKTFEPFAQGLRDLGRIEGQNISFERRYARPRDMMSFRASPRSWSSFTRT